jgi:MFS family permease
MRISWAFGVVCAHTLLFQAVTFLLRPTAAYRAIELGVSAAWLGLLVAAFALVPLLLALPAGDLADRYGESAVMIAGALVMAAAALLLVVDDNSFGVLLLGMVLLGTGHLLCAVGQQSWVGNRASRGGLDSAFGYYTFAGSVGQVAGPGLLAVFGSGSGLPPAHDVFVTSFALTAAMVLVTLLVRRTPRPAATVSPRDRRVVALLRTPGLPRALVVSSVVLAAMDITLVYLPALGAEVGLSVGVVGALLTARSVATMTSRLFTGVLTAWLGRRLLLVISIASSGVALAAVAASVPLGVMFASVVVAGFGLGLCQPATLAWLAEIAGPGVRGKVMSLRLVGNRFGQVVVPTAIGLVAAGLGAAGVLWVTAGALVLAAGASRSLPVDARGEGGTTAV